MYQFQEKIDHKGHFWFNKKIILDRKWADLPSASKSIFPVIASHSDSRGFCFPGEQRIAILSGLTEKTARAGVAGLENFEEAVIVTPYLTRRGRRSKQFIVALGADGPGQSFPFFSAIFHTGSWRMLKPAAQAVYPVMRSFGFFDQTIFEIQFPGEWDGTEDAFKDNFQSRKWDFCEAEIGVLADYAGVSRRSLSSALGDLEKYGLAERFAEGGLAGWKVYLHPKYQFRHDQLNEHIARKYTA